MRDVGHLLGSASIEVWLTEAGHTKKIVFSGDIGNTNQPLIKDPLYVDDADYVVMESTYGNRSHDDQGRAINEDPEPARRSLEHLACAMPGRIRHHLKHNLWRPECTILFAGYQAEGSLGSVLLGGAKNIRLFGEEICCKGTDCTHDGNKRSRRQRRTCALGKPYCT